MNKIIIGLTGGIASGKSEAAKEFERLGCGIVDTDIIARKVSAKGNAGEALLHKLFPDAFINGVICRSTLRKLVFDNINRRRELDAVMHPLILDETKLQIEDCTNDIVIVVVPLLFEAGFDSLTDFNVSINCNEEIRIQRLTERDNIAVELAKKMIASQMNDKERENRADYVIHNNSGTQNLRLEVQKFLEHIRQDRIK